MIKQNKTTLIVTTLVMLLPMLVGLLLWNQLPEQLPSHWDIHGNVDDWSSKTFSVFGFPAMLIGIHWICVFASSADPKSKNYTPKMRSLVLWLCPIISLVLHSVVYATALGHSISIEIVLPLIEGVLFIIVGNLLPKCRQSYTLGIKLPWTLASEENWNKTHRFGGKVWVAGGVLLMASVFWSSIYFLIGTLAVMVLAPTLYSFLYFLKYEKNAK